jgi:predicted cupin superfamily sugar epimerase
MHPDVAKLIEHYDLVPLEVEGTLFTSTYRSEADVADGGPVGSAIIGLYSHEPLSRSLFHRLPADEIWHFYGGDPIRLVLLSPDGSSEDVWLGADIASGQHVQYVIPAGTWQAGELASDGVYGLFGCTMAPGFTGSGFEGGAKSVLLASHPDQSYDIERLGIPDDRTLTMRAGFAT